MALVAAGIVVANNGLGLNLPSNEIITVAGVITAYILGQSFVDGKK